MVCVNGRVLWESEKMSTLKFEWVKGRESEWVSEIEREREREREEMPIVPRIESLQNTFSALFFWRTMSNPALNKWRLSKHIGTSSTKQSNVLVSLFFHARLETSAITWNTTRVDQREKSAIIISALIRQPTSLSRQFSFFGSVKTSSGNNWPLLWKPNWPLLSS